MSGRSAITSGTATAPASASHRSPAASAAKNPAGGVSSSGQVLANKELPSSRVSRLATQMSPPGTGVSRIR